MKTERLQMMDQLTVDRTESLYPRLRKPGYVIQYLNHAISEEKEEECPGLLALSLSQVIQANSDLIFVPYLLVPMYSIHLSLEDNLTLIDVLEETFKEDKEEIRPIVNLLEQHYLLTKKGHHLKQVKITFRATITYEDGTQEELSGVELIKWLKPESVQNPDYNEWESALKVA